MPDLCADITAFLDNQPVGKGGDLRSAELSRKPKSSKKDRFDNALVTAELAEDLREVLAGESRGAGGEKAGSQGATGSAVEPSRFTRLRSVFKKSPSPSRALENDAKADKPAKGTQEKQSGQETDDDYAPRGGPDGHRAEVKGPPPTKEGSEKMADHESKARQKPETDTRFSVADDDNRLPVPSGKAPLKALYKRVGTRSKIYGIGFAALSAVFLILSLSNENIVLQVDSVVSFIAAIVLLFKDPRKRVQTRALDALLLSSGQTMAELSGQKGVWFAYEAKGEKISDVVAMPSQVEGGSPLVMESEMIPLSVTPPGRGLADLFTREAGLKLITLDILRVSLPEMMVDNFGLAESIELTIRDGIAEVVLHHSSATCSCSDDPRRLKGYLGCTIASSLAVMFCAATRQPLLLQKCVHDDAADTWKIPMVLGPSGIA